MVTCKCGGNLVVDNTDSRQEWTEEELTCVVCGSSYTHRTEYSNGLVVSDTLTEVNDELESYDAHERERIFHEVLNERIPKERMEELTNILMSDEHDEIIELYDSILDLEAMK